MAQESKAFIDSTWRQVIHPVCWHLFKCRNGGRELLDERLKQVHHTGRTARSGVVLWLWWVASITVIGTLSYLTTGGLVTLYARSDKMSQEFGGSNFMTGDNALGPAVQWVFLLIVLFCPSIGIAQGMVLHRILNYRDWKRWTLATALGLIVTLMVVTIECIGIPAAGIALGLIQWLVLRRSINNAGLWIMTTAIALCLGVGISAFVTLNYLPKTLLVFPAWPFYPFSAVLYWGFGVSICILVFASVTGIILVWISDRSAGLSAQLFNVYRLTRSSHSGKARKTKYKRRLGL